MQSDLFGGIIRGQFEWNGDTIQAEPLAPLVGFLLAIPELVRFAVAAFLYGFILRRAGENLRRYGLYCVNLYCAAVSVQWAVVAALPEVSYFGVFGTPDIYPRSFQVTASLHWWFAKLALFAIVLFFVFLLVGLFSRVRARLRS